MTLEREIAEKWVREWLSAHPKDYWIRIPDSADGIKPFDGVLFMHDELRESVSVAIEFKVWRLKRKAFDYSTVEPHQMRELLRFQNGAERKSVILVYYEHERKWSRYKPSESKLREIIMKRRAPGGIRRPPEPKEES